MPMSGGPDNEIDGQTARRQARPRRVGTSYPVLPEDTGAALEDGAGVPDLRGATEVLGVGRRRLDELVDELGAGHDLALVCALRLHSIFAADFGHWWHKSEPAFYEYIS